MGDDGVGPQLRQWRRDAGLTQGQLAERAQLSTAAVRDLEQGRVRRPRPEHARRLAQVLGVDAALWAQPSPSPSEQDPRSEGPSPSDQDLRVGSLRIGVLGSLLVRPGGAEPAALPAGQRVVLGLLALAGGSPVRLDTLVDALWGERGPAGAAGIVQTYISRLRSVLGRDRAYLPARDGAGYRLALTAADELDLITFRRLVQAGRAAHAAGDLAAACRAYDSALELWRGEPLADIDVLHGHPAIIALTVERTAAIAEFAALASSRGWHDQVLPHLRAMTARDPLDEAGHAMLMIALAGTGRQAEALQAYEQLWRRLDQQLGVRPGPALREAHVNVLRQDVVLAGRRPVFQLPAPPADFTGRAAVTAAIVSAVTPVAGPGVPTVAISGPPGIGKTALTLYVAHKLRDQFPDGQLWVELAGASALPRDPGDVLGELLRALGLPGAAIPANLAERAVAYRSRLAGQRTLVVLDDAATAAQVRLLTPGTAGCAMLVTSRVSLEGLDGAHLVPLDVMTSDDAASLLTQIIGPHRVQAQPAAVTQLVEACGALPLAVRIVGAKLAARPSWPLSVMVSKITDEHDRMRELEAGDLSVRASIASSYESLPERLRRAFRLLSLLGPSDFAEWVAGVLLGEPDACDVIGELTTRSLLMPLGVDAAGEPRYRLHDLLRSYAAERLAEEPPGERADARKRLLTGWLQLAQRANGQLPPEPYFPPPAAAPSWRIVADGMAERLTADPIAWFTAERINLRTAVKQACQLGPMPLARQLTSFLSAFHHLQDRHDEAELLWRTIADSAGRSGDRQADACFARLRAAASVIERGRAWDALTDLTQCVLTAEQAGDSEVLALALYWRGACAFDLDDMEQARQDVQRGVSVARQAGSQVAELINLRLLGNALGWLGHGDQAVAASEQAVVVADALGPAPYRLAALGSLAFSCVHAGQYDRAVSVSRTRIQLSQELGDARGEGLARGVLGDAYQRMGQYELAAGSLRQALPLFEKHYAPRYHALCLQKLGHADEAMGRYREAIGYLEQAMVMFRQLDLPHKVEEAQQALDRCRGIPLP